MHSRTQDLKDARPQGRAQSILSETMASSSMPRCATAPEPGMVTTGEHPPIADN